MLNNAFITFLELEHWIINICLFFSFVGYFYFAYKNKFEDFEVLFLDVGGSMDDHIDLVERLFSATKSVFKNICAEMHCILPFFFKLVVKF